MTNQWSYLEANRAGDESGSHGDESKDQQLPWSLIEISLLLEFIAPSA